MRRRAARERAAIWVAAVAATAGALVGVASAGEPRDCRVDSQPRNTEYDVLHVCNQAQLDALFSRLTPGPMPAYGARAHGYWRWYPDGQDAAYPADEAFDAAVWQGKVFYTHARGGRAMDLVAGGQLAFPARVDYAAARLDGHRAIVVDYARAGDPLGLVQRDEIRRLQPGLYLGFAWFGPVNSSRLRATFLLDFRNS